MYVLLVEQLSISLLGAGTYVRTIRERTFVTVFNSIDLINAALDYFFSNQLILRNERVVAVHGPDKTCWLKLRTNVGVCSVLVVFSRERGIWRFVTFTKGQ